MKEVGVCNSCCETRGLRGRGLETCFTGWGQGCGQNSRSQLSCPISALFPGLNTQAQLQTARTELGEAQGKLLEHQSALKELSERGELGMSPRPLISHRASHLTLDSHPDPSVTPDPIL